MKTQKFDDWVACCLKQNEVEVSKLLNDKTTMQFLIAWSLLEMTCFKGFVKISDISSFVFKKSIDCEETINGMNEYVEFFHARYLDSKKYGNLMHKQKCQRMEDILKKSFVNLSPQEKLFFAMVVVYRYRNNIFHGNKGVESWLAYGECILKCIKIMQILIPIPAIELDDDL